MTYFHVSMKKTMTTRVRRRRPRVPPRKGRQPLPQFGAGRLTPRQMRTLMMARDPRRLGIFPKRGQRGTGIFSMVSKVAGRMAAKAAGRVAKKAAKQAAKKLAAQMTKQVAKKVAKKTAMGAVAGGAGWATTKFFDKFI